MPTRYKKLTPEVIYTLDSLWQLEKTIIDTLDFRQIVHNMVQKILSELSSFYTDYTYVSLFLVDEKKGVLQETADTSRTADSFNTGNNCKSEIPLTETTNIAIQTIKQNAPAFTYNLNDLFGSTTQHPATSSKTLYIILPINVREQTVGVMIFGVGRKIEDVSDMERSLMQYFTNLIAIAVQNSRLYTNLEAETHQLVDANLNLRNLDKLKDEFISVTSHELRTPMTVIKSYLWLLQNEKGGKLSEKQQVYVQKAVKGTERMIALINDMLNISKIEQSNDKIPTEKINLRALIEETVEEFKVKVYEKGLKLEATFGNDCDNALASKPQLKEVLSNLIANAIKFTEEGKIRIKTECSSEKFVRVSVTDSGKGIAKESVGKLFSKFGRVENTFRTVAEAEGTGLGLYIVKKLVRGMGGEVGVFSGGEGRGSTFWFTLSRVKMNM